MPGTHSVSLTKCREVSPARRQEGFTLLETLLALTLVGIILVGLLGALTTSSKATIINDEHATADNLAQAQLEYVRNQTYDNVNDPPQYALISGVPEGYAVASVATRLDPDGDGTGDEDGLQKIEVTVQHRGRTVVTLETYRVK